MTLQLRNYDPALMAGAADALTTPQSITDATSQSFAVGPNGATNPVFNVDSSTASAATGITVKGAAAGNGVAVTVISSGTDENLKIDAKGAGTVTINGTATGAVTITPDTTVSGTLTSTGAFTASGAATVGTTLGVTGATTLGAALKSTTATLTGAGAVGLTTLVTKIVTTGANALTLADGTDGQIKILVMTTDGGDGTLTPTTKTGYSTIVFNDAGDGCVLVFTTTTGWIVAGNNGCTIS